MDSAAQETPQLEQQAVTPNLGAGVAEGTVLTTPEGFKNEVVIYDRDPATGEIIGWHKELEA
jgi:hypothetical protein